MAQPHPVADYRVGRPSSSHYARRRRAKSSPVMNVTAPAVLALLAVSAWHLATQTQSLPQWVLPSPAQFASRLLLEIWRSQTWTAFAWTTYEAALGCLVGAAIALPLAYLIYRSKVVAAAIEPFLGATQAIPAIALAPLLVLWIGYGTAAIVALCALMVFFPILLGATLGLRQLDVNVLEAANLDGAHGLRLLLSIEGPLALHAITTGLRNGFTLSITGAVVGEMVMGGTGLGTVLTAQRHAVDTTGMFVTITLLCVLAMTIYTALYLFERWWVRQY
ncbi:MAG: ABC transporter permease [Actinomycetaceae bacterium]|nr:ABC transporter permease [Actinomycetaceae bacterium]